jgi:epoxyqueuosine reductase QueG
VSGSADRAARERLTGVLGPAGFDVCGVIGIERYDVCVAPPWRSERLLPGARRAVVIGSGGRALWRAFERAPEFGVGSDPLDAYCERIAAEAVAALAGTGHPAVAILAHHPRDGTFADLVALGREAGLGAPSRLGLLVHPVYGPWLSLRAVVLTAAEVPVTPKPEAFDPCTGCPAPCASACHGAAVLPAGFDVGRCAATRARDPACAARCDARHACVLGQDHAYLSSAEAHHMRRGGSGAPRHPR